MTEEPKMKPKYSRIMRLLLFLISIGIFTGIILISFGILSSYQNSSAGIGMESLYIPMIGIILLFLSYTIAMFIRRPKKKILHTFSIEKCNNCNYTEIRDFKKGDYVYKETDRCECGGLRYVDLIYAIETEVGERAETIPS